MKVYLKNGGKQRHLTVNLVEGHLPKVNDLSNNDTKSTENLEPAIWFKVMVVKSIHIDCVDRVVQWSNGKKDEENSLFMNTVYGSEQSCYDFDDDVDELFNLAIFLIEENPILYTGKKKNQGRVNEYELAVFRMLHCYILGKVTLQPCDIEVVQGALSVQQKAIAQLEDTALVHSRLAEHYLAQMRNIRELEILPVLEDLFENQMVNQEFIDGLLFDLKKAERSLRNEVDSAQKTVDRLKENMKYDRCSKISHELECARYERNHMTRNLQLHIVGRELCRTSTVSPGEHEMNDNCNRYLKIRKRLFNEKSIANIMIEKKVRAASVRECIESVLKELAVGEESTGDDCTVDGQRVTDVNVSENCAPEWQTLTQRLTSIVYNKEHPVGINFRVFCAERLNHYEDILRSVEYLTSGPQSDPSGCGDFYIISEKDFGLTTLFLQNQCDLILSHIYQITELLACSFSNDWHMFTRKIRLCYEKCFYKRIGRELILMYRLVNAKSMQTFEERIAKLKTHKICELDLQMKTEWWLELFERDDVYDEKNSVMNLGSCSYVMRGYATDGGSESDERTDFVTDFDEDEYSDLKEKQHNNSSMKNKLLASKKRTLSRSCFELHEEEENMTKTYSALLQNDMKQQADSQSVTFKPDVLVNLIDESDLNSSSSDVSVSSSPDLRRSNSITAVISRSMSINKTRQVQPCDSFDLHFGGALKAIKEVFSNPSPLKKMQCLTNALKLVAGKVEELRMRDQDETLIDRSDIAVTAEDLLPLLVLLILKLSPYNAAKLYIDLIFVSDLMAEFLSSGCHSYALCEFQIAFRVLDQTCEELGIAVE